MPRLFIAVPTPKEFVHELRQTQAAIAQELEQAGVRGFRAENLSNSHCTLRFLGETEDETIPDLAIELGRSLASCPKFAISLGRVGMFPERGRVRVLWQALEPVSGLRELKNAVDQAVERAGLIRNESVSDFTPHLTLFRFRESAQLIQLKADARFATASCDRVGLYSSELAPGGAIHTPLRLYPLGAGD